ncbi:MAG TPA: hypothetical protein VFW23_12760 [Tepidisphaeraceae bacterium]|nr:hypothetical protein [Tepidisphaeraceae bacterium]
MPSTTMQFKEFIDLLLVRLYELDRADGGQFFDLNAIAREAKDQIPSSWPFDAAKVLETRGLARCIYTFGGTHAQLTGEGRLYVEEDRGTTRKIREAPAHYFNVTISGNNNQIAAGHHHQGTTQTLALEQEREPAFRLLDEATKTLQDDQTLNGATRAEGMTYLELLRLQLKKQEPDRSLVAAVLEPLSKISSIAGNVATLIRLFNAWQ